MEEKKKRCNQGNKGDKDHDKSDLKYYLPKSNSKKSVQAQKWKLFKKMNVKRGKK